MVRSFLRTRLSGVLPLPVGILFFCSVSSFSHHNVVWIWPQYFSFVPFYMKLVSLNFKNEAGFWVAFLISQGSLFCCFLWKCSDLLSWISWLSSPLLLTLDFPLTLSLLFPLSCSWLLPLLAVSTLQGPQVISWHLWVLGSWGSLPPFKMLKIILYDCVDIKMNILGHFPWPKSAFFPYDFRRNVSIPWVPKDQRAPGTVASMLRDSFTLEGPCPGRVLPGSLVSILVAPLLQPLSDTAGFSHSPGTILLHIHGYCVTLWLPVAHLYLLVFWCAWDNMSSSFVVNTVQGVSVLLSMSSVCFYVWI